MSELNKLEVIKPQSGALQELAELYEIPAEAVELIQKFDEENDPKVKAGYHELTVVLDIQGRNMEETLLYALNKGTAYVIENGKIYIWHKPFQRLEGSAFYRLKRFTFLYGGRSVKYVLDGNDMLPNKE